MYWPNAILVNKDGSTRFLFTYTSVFSIEDAKKQIDFWQEQYPRKICFWYIADSNNQIIEYQYTDVY